MPLPHHSTPLHPPLPIPLLLTPSSAMLMGGFTWMQPSSPIQPFPAIDSILSNGHSRSRQSTAMHSRHCAGLCVFLPLTYSYSYSYSSLHLFLIHTSIHSLTHRDLILSARQKNHIGIVFSTLGRQGNKHAFNVCSSLILYSFHPSILPFIFSLFLSLYLSFLPSSAHQTHHTTLGRRISHHAHPYHRLLL